MSIPAGDLTHRIQFQEQTVTEDPEFGGCAGGSTWTNVGGPVWVRRTNTLRATAEAVASGTEVNTTQVRFDMRPRAVNPRWRAMGVGTDHDGLIYDIRAVGTSNDRSETAVIAVSGAKN